MFEVTDENTLMKHLKSNTKVVALFYASWCPFCRTFLSTFSKHAENDRSAAFMRVKIDEDENPLWEMFSLAAVPSIIFFKNGKVERRLDCNLGVGLTENQFIRWLNGIQRFSTSTS